MKHFKLIEQENQDMAVYIVTAKMPAPKYTIASTALQHLNNRNHPKSIPQQRHH